jgi:lipopolysaccharide exporter
MSDATFNGQSSTELLVRGSAWVALGQGVTALSGLISSVLAARLLAPEDFGIMGVALLATATLNSLSQTGFDRALIQRKQIDGYVDVAWTAQVMRGALLAVVVLALAVPLAHFYAQPELVAIFSLMSVGLLAGGFCNASNMFFHRELNFKLLITIDTSRAIFKLILLWILLLQLGNVWALVIAHVSSSLFDLAASYFSHSHRPRFDFNLSRMRELLRYGKWVSGMSILALVVTRGDDLFVSKYLGLHALGLYAFAFEIANLPATQVTHAVGKVSFPTYSRLFQQGDFAGVRQTFQQVMKATLLITAPLSALIFLTIAPLVEHVFGQQWQPIVPLVRILVCAGFVRSIVALAMGLFHGVGRPQLDFYMNLPRFLVLTFGIWPACAWFGLRGASWLTLLAVGSCLPTWYLGVAQHTQLTWREILRTQELPFMITMSLFVVYWALSVWVPPVTPVSFAALMVLVLLCCLGTWGLVGKWSRFNLLREIHSLTRVLKRT